MEKRRKPSQAELVCWRAGKQKEKLEQAEEKARVCLGEDPVMAQLRTLLFGDGWTQKENEKALINDCLRAVRLWRERMDFIFLEKMTLKNYIDAMMKVFCVEFVASDHAQVRLSCDCSYNYLSVGIGACLEGGFNKVLNKVVLDKIWEALQKILMLDQDVLLTPTTCMAVKKAFIGSYHSTLWPLLQDLEKYQEVRVIGKIFQELISA